jgi:hypothetical protein
MFERQYKKLLVFAFMAVFVRYCPQFCGSGVIYKSHETQYIFERHDQKLVVSHFRAVLMRYCQQLWGSGVIY